MSTGAGPRRRAHPNAEALSARCDGSKSGARPITCHAPNRFTSSFEYDERNLSASRLRYDYPPYPLASETVIVIRLRYLRDDVTGAPDKDAVPDLVNCTQQV